MRAAKTLTSWRNIAGMLAVLVLLPGQRAMAALPSTAASSDLHAVAAAQRIRPRAPRLPRAAFIAPSALTAVRLSPDGEFVAYLRAEGETRSLWTMPTRGGRARLLVARTSAEQVSWSRDSRWLFLRAPQSLAAVAVDGRAGVRIPMGGAQRRQLMRVDPSQAAAVLMRERVRAGTHERWRVVRMDARGRRTLLFEDAYWIHDVAIDPAGRLAALTRFEGDHDTLHRVRADGSLREVLRLQPMQRASLLATLADGSLLIEGNAGGNFNRVLRLDARDVLHTLHEDPRGEADLDEVGLDPRTQRPMIASYRSTRAATYGIGDTSLPVAAIARQLPGRDIAVQVASGRSAPWLVAERAATLRDARWHLFDPRSGRLRAILGDASLPSRAMPEATLARKMPIAYTASDGVRVHGFVLLPPGVDAAHAPLVAHVHGGPINHFRDGYDSIAQFLANRGYVVFQSNFRGSTGFGRDYTFAARGDFGNGRVQRDIVEGVRWLLAQGIGDAQRVGIVGHSFGGYSTLLGVTFQPELFKVGVAGAPPADFGWAMRWLVDAGEQGARPDRSLLATVRALSVDPGDPASRARLRAQSPQANATRMRRPLLLLAGGADRVVPIRAVTHYAATLKALQRPVSLLVEPDGAHSPSDPLPREAYLYAMEVTLQRHLRGIAPEAPGAGLRDYLRQNLRLAGPEFTGVPPRR